MSTNVACNSDGRREAVFACGVLLFMIAASALTTIAPIALSVVIVFLFAGPHNYVEARYFLTRLPARMGQLKPFFLVSFIGILSLSVTFPLLGRLPVWLGWNPVSSLWLTGIWNTAFVLWCTTLVMMRSRHAPRRDWDYALPIGLAITGVCWLAPPLLPFVLVYAHPLMGLWILDRELRKQSPSLRRVFRLCVCLLPVLLVLQWTLVGELSVDVFPVSGPLRDQILRHSFLPIFSVASGPRLVSIHAFLELLHYGVWLVAIPVVSGRVYSQRFSLIPLMRTPLRTAIRWMLLASLFVVFLLWIFFLADYSATRDIYFAVATVHVLAEIPFLLRLL